MTTFETLVLVLLGVCFMVAVAIIQRLQRLLELHSSLAERLDERWREARHELGDVAAAARWAMHRDGRMHDGEGRVVREPADEAAIMFPDS